LHKSLLIILGETLILKLNFLIEKDILKTLDMFKKKRIFFSTSLLTKEYVARGKMAQVVHLLPGKLTGTSVTAGQSSDPNTKVKEN